MSHVYIISYLEDGARKLLAFHDEDAATYYTALFGSDKSVTHVRLDKVPYAEWEGDV